MIKKIHLFTRLAITSLVFLLSVLTANGYLAKDYVSDLEDLLYDFRLLRTLENKVDERIVILDIDENSLQQIGHWPWPRRTMAELVNILFNDYQINVLGFDASFPEEEETSAAHLINKLQQTPEFSTPAIQNILQQQQQLYQGNELFAESVVARNLVLGYTFEDWVGDGVEYIKKGILPEPIFTKEQVEPLNLIFHKAGGYIGNYELLGFAASYAGYFSYPKEGSTLRKIPLFHEFDGNIYPSLDLQMVLTAKQTSGVELLFDTGISEKSHLTIEAIRVADHDIPVAEKFSVYIPYRGPMYSFPYISVADVLAKRTQLESLKDKIVILGTSAAGLLDLRSTPVGDTYAGVEVHANVISGLLDNSFKIYPVYQTGIELAMLLGFALILGYLLPKFGAIGASLSFTGCIGFLYFIALYAWNNANLILPMASSLLLIVSMTFLHLNYDLFVESRQKKRMNRLFGQYIPGELVKELDASEQDLSLSGESRDMSVLFSDVRGFTTISEGLKPSELTQLMNEFLTPITQIIHEQRGTIDKYMGDAVMAFWGAPLNDPNHSKNAILAAFKMKKAMQVITPEFQAKGWPEIKIGIGISSGNMRVGNMGSQFRMAYTVLGDVVNLGSRLEGLTKNYGVDIIVSEVTKQNAPEFVYREIDRVRVKGKHEPVVIFEPLMLLNEVDAELTEELGLYHQAITHYLKQHWDQAKNILRQLADLDNKIIYQVYLERIENYRQNPPPPDWDGVFVHTSK